MGYNSHVSGELTVTPSLESESLFDAYRDTGGDLLDLTIEDHPGEETVTVLPDGSVGVVGQPGHSTITCRWEDEFKAYDFETSVSDLVSAIARHTSAEVNGVLRVSGEEDADIWRIRVEKNVVHVERPKLVWPNGEEEAL